MGQLTVAHTTLHIVIAPLAITVFLGLAIYVITCNPRRPISWVFSILCLTVATIYLDSLFLTSKPEVHFSISHFLMRWKWAAITLGSTLYLHLVFFYLPPGWQQYRLWVLLPAYLLSVGFALLALFTDLLVAGHLHFPAPHSVSYTPGPFMVFYTGFFILELLGAVVGLVSSYRLTRSPSYHQQIVYLLIPTILVLLGSIIHWITLLTETAPQIPHELPDALLVLGAVLYARTVVQYGSFVGRPLAWRSMFYSTLATVAGLTALYLTLTLDQWLTGYTTLPYYLVTGLLVLILATTFPTVSQWLTERLDQWFFRVERRQQELAYRLAETLVEIPDPVQMQSNLLDTLRAVLDVRDGYVALSISELLPNQLIVQIVQGPLPLKPGDLICRPPLHGKEPQLAAALLPQPQTAPGWQEIALFCPFTIDQDTSGVLALGEKRDRTSFSPHELILCAELTKQLDSFGRVVHLRGQHNNYLEITRLQEQTLRRLGEDVITSVKQPLSAWQNQTAPLEIRVLGPLQVWRDGQLVSEAAWGSEKAKALLAYLLWKGPNGVTREELLQALWPQRFGEEAANVFHVIMHRLRRVLQPGVYRASDSDYIHYDCGRYYFDIEAPHTLDAVVFQTLIASEDPKALRMALELYRGPYLEDVAWSLPADVEVERRKLEQLYADLLRRLVVQTRGREALLYLEKLLAIEPADETAQRALVLGSLTLGRSDLAKRQIARWQQALAELDLEPSPETRALWERVDTRTGVIGHSKVKK